MDELYRYDEPTNQWVKVSNLNRIEVQGGGGGGTGIMSANIYIGALFIEDLMFSAEVVV